MQLAFRYAGANNPAQNEIQRCRLLYVIGQLGPGGAERQLYLLLKSMDRKAYFPHVAVWNFNPEDTYVSVIRDLGIPLHFFPATLNPVQKMLAFRRLVFELQPEVIHSYSFYTNVAAWWAALGRKIVAVGGMRSNFINDRQSCGILLGSLCARWPQHQIFNSFAAAETTRKSRTVFAPRWIFVVQNGLDLGQFPKTPLPRNGQARIVGVGSLLQYKRWDRLLKAAAALKQSGYDFRVDIVGDGPLRKSLERQAQNLTVADRVSFVGYVKDVSDFLAKATFLAHTSELEGCPNVIMEAMACGRAVVAMDAGDIPALVEDRKTGFVVRRGDDAAFARHLAELITNRDLCRELGNTGRVRAERKFSLASLVEQTTAAYRGAGWRDA
jgi:glycosyltransferase involved in cell wall biosynthesis